MTSLTPTAAYLEIGEKRVFACALDWPGWCRSARSEELALEALRVHLPRYAPVAREAGLALPPGADAFDVGERLPGTATTDFGAPGAIATGDGRPIGVEEAGRLAALVEAAWTTLDRVARRAPADLRKGPRGGGRDRDGMVEHVLGAEAAYARKLGVRHRQPALGDGPAILALRAAIAAELRRPSDGAPPVPTAWPRRYAARRIAWHVLDHAWEMEDRGRPGS
jgi:hypothetical protein